MNNRPGLFLHVQPVTIRARAGSFTMTSRLRLRRNNRRSRRRTTSAALRTMNLATPRVWSHGTLAAASGSSFEFDLLFHYFTRAPIRYLR